MKVLQNTILVLFTLAANPVACPAFASEVPKAPLGSWVYLPKPFELQSEVIGFERPSAVYSIYTHNPTGGSLEVRCQRQFDEAPLAYTSQGLWSGFTLPVTHSVGAWCILYSEAVHEVSYGVCECTAIPCRCDINDFARSMLGIPEGL